MSLYRKHRPQQFADLVGQDHISKVLTNALVSGNIGHAYLFYGSRGSGKTTSARLLAKALNCTGRKLEKDHFEPCDNCTSCKEITAGNSMDVIEIDAASNRGIDEIRDLREKIRFAPTSSKYKVYVIDECHMLTKEAFNALLKTLEEPPKHAIFILATTELHKVPATILSRVQVFDFKKAKAEEILGLLKDIVKKEKIEIHEDALKLIARLSYGAYRDGISMLDQISSIKLAGGEKISLEQVQQILGQTTEKSVWDFLEYLSLRSRKEALKLVAEIYFDGKDLENFILETIKVLRKIVLYKAGINEEIDLTDDEGRKIVDLSEKFTLLELTNLIEKMMVILPKVKASVMGQLPLEIVVFEFTKKEDEVETLPKVEKIVEKPVEKIIDIPVEKIVVEEKVIETPKEVDEPVVEIKKAEIPKIDEIKEEPTKILEQSPEVKDVLKVWPELIKKMKVHNNTLAASFRGGEVRDVAEDNIVMAFKFKFHADQISNNKNLPIIESMVKEVTGHDYKIECVVDTEVKVKKPLEAEEELLSSAKEVFGI